MLRCFHRHQRQLSPNLRRCYSVRIPAAKRENSTIRLVQYNILSDYLCTKDTYCHNNPEAVSNPRRVELLIRKITKEMEGGSVLCLQEVSQSLSGRLMKEFSDNGYTFASRNYGGKHNGYMGVGIAFDHTKYSAQRIEHFRVSDERNWASQDLEEAHHQWPITKRANLINYAIAAERNNAMVFVELKDKSTEKHFCVATYHMPCEFEYPGVMTIHATLSTEAALKRAGNKPLAYCGDFNIKPNTDIYKAITTGLLPDEKSEANPGVDADQSAWMASLPRRLNSAYTVGSTLKREPAFTNYAHTLNATKPFLACLDYIFLTDEFKVDCVEELPQTIHEVGGLLPSTSHPSDHLMLAANVTIAT